MISSDRILAWVLQEEKLGQVKAGWWCMYFSPFSLVCWFHHKKYENIRFILWIGFAKSSPSVGEVHHRRFSCGRFWREVKQKSVLRWRLLDQACGCLTSWPILKILTTSTGISLQKLCSSKSKTINTFKVRWGWRGKDDSDRRNIFQTRGRWEDVRQGCARLPPRLLLVKPFL